MNLNNAQLKLIRSILSTMIETQTLADKNIDSTGPLDPIEVEIFWEGFTAKFDWVAPDIEAIRNMYQDLPAESNHIVLLIQPVNQSFTIWMEFVISEEVKLYDMGVLILADQAKIIRDITLELVNTDKAPRQYLNDGWSEEDFNEYWLDIKGDNEWIVPPLAFFERNPDCSLSDYDRPERKHFNINLWNKNHDHNVCIHFQVSDKEIELVSLSLG